jgi:DnaK suppressor protein
MNNRSIKEKLLTIRKQLQATAETRGTFAKTVELDQSKVGRLSRIDALQSQEIAKASVARGEQLLLQIDAALVRIEKNEFGICRICDEAIAALRLEADPMAIFCVNCAAARERL